MPVTEPRDTLIAFDLDDTLLHETDYIRAVVRAIARAYPTLPQPHVSLLRQPYKLMEKWADGDTLTLDGMIHIYRTAQGVEPIATQAPEILSKLKQSGHTLALITDGHTIRQLAKLNLLGITTFFDIIWISEEQGADKLSGTPFKRIPELFPDIHTFIYVGDNPAKDFAPAHSHNWQTIMLKASPENIHPQSAGTPAMKTIDSLHDIEHV